MDLLNQIIRQPVEPDYAVAATRGHEPARGRWTLALLAVIIGALFAVAALQTTRAAPALQLERTELINRVLNAEHEQDQLRGRVTSLTQEIATLRTAALGDDDAANSLETRIDVLDPVVGNVGVTGPGVLIVVDDSPSAKADSRDRVLDIDLRVRGVALTIDDLGGGDGRLGRQQIAQALALRADVGITARVGAAT